MLLAARYWEILAFMAGRLGTVSLAAHSIAYNVTPLCFMVPLGLSIGTSIRVGTLLGEGNPKRKCWRSHYMGEGLNVRFTSLSCFSMCYVYL